MKKLTFDESWIIFKCGVWKTWKLKYLVYFQLNQRYLCVGTKLFEKGLKKYAKVRVHDFKFLKTKARRRILQKFLDRSGIKHIPEDKYFFDKEIKQLLKDPEGGFKAQDYAFKYGL